MHNHLQEHCYFRARGYTAISVRRNSPLRSTKFKFVEHSFGELSARFSEYLGFSNPTSHTLRSPKDSFHSRTLQLSLCNAFLV